MKRNSHDHQDWWTSENWSTFSSQNLTDWTAILLAIALLAILRFLYWKWGATWSQTWDRQAKVEIQKQIKEEMAQKKIIPSDEAEIQLGDFKERYTPFTVSNLEKSRKDWTKTAIFFHSKTCSSCAKLHKNIMESDIPENIHIYKADRDAENVQILAKEYWVDKYHTVSYPARWEDGKPKNVKWLFDLKSLITEFEKEKEEVNEDIKENIEAQLPERYMYLKSNEYVSSDQLENFWWDETITRATATPFLARYWFLNNLEIKSSVEDCDFPDVKVKADQLQKSIIAACGYDLLRWSNGDFIPDRTMSKDELLTVLVRTKTGYLPEDTAPWFKNYFEYSKKNWLVDETTDISEFNGDVTKSDLWKRLYRLSLVK